MTRTRSDAEAIALRVRRPLEIAARCALLCVCLVLALACGDSGRDDPGDTTSADVEEEAREAVDAAADSVAEQRRKIAARAREIVTEVERQVFNARRKLESLSDEARGEVEQAIDRADRARQTLTSELDALHQRGEESWGETEKRLSRAMDEVSEARQEIRAALAGEDDASG